MSKRVCRSAARLGYTGASNDAINWAMRLPRKPFPCHYALSISPILLTQRHQLAATQQIEICWRDTKLCSFINQWHWKVVRWETKCIVAKWLVLKCCWHCDCSRLGGAVSFGCNSISRWQMDVKRTGGLFLLKVTMSCQGFCYAGLSRSSVVLRFTLTRTSTFSGVSAQSVCVRSGRSPPWICGPASLTFLPFVAIPSPRLYGPFCSKGDHYLLNGHDDVLNMN